MASPELALPAIVAVVWLAEVIQGRVLGGEGASTVTGEVGAENSEVMHLRLEAGLLDQGVHRGRSGAAPRCVGMESMPLVQQESLGALEDYGPWVVESLREGILGDFWHLA